MDRGTMQAHAHSIMRAALEDPQLEEAAKQLLNTLLPQPDLSPGASVVACLLAATCCVEMALADVGFTLDEKAAEQITIQVQHLLCRITKKLTVTRGTPHESRATQKNGKGPPN